eukprot:Pgem_evm1s864
MNFKMMTKSVLGKKADSILVYSMYSHNPRTSKFKKLQKKSLHNHELLSPSQTTHKRIHT